MLELICLFLLFKANLQVWKYKGTKKLANFALEHAVADVTMPQGIMERDILFSAGAYGLR